MTDLLTIGSVMLAGVAIVLVYICRREAPLMALAALVCGGMRGDAPLSAGTLAFWGAAALIAFGIGVMLPPTVSRARTGVPFFATGALAGTAVGMAMNTSAAIILGAAVGVAFGALALGRMKAGKLLEFPSRRFFNYLLAKGLPIVVTFSMIGILCLLLMTNHK